MTAGPGDVPSRAAIEAWSQEQRDQVARILDDLAGRPDIGTNRRRRLAVLVITGCSAAGLIPWILYLNATLPTTSSGGAWRTAWVGFDVGLVGALAFAGWMAMRRRQLVMLALAVAATLLLVDAWFDITLSWGTNEHLASIITAVAIELPVAGFFLAVDWSLHKRVVALVAALRGRGHPTVSLWRAPIVMRD